MPRRSPFTPWHPPTKPRPAEVAAALVLGAPTAEGQARAAALVRGWEERDGRGNAGADGSEHGAAADNSPDAVLGGVALNKHTNRNRARGDAVETVARRELRAAGWFINSGRTGSFGAADIEAHRTAAVAATDRPGVEVVHVQVKRTRGFASSALNAAIKRILALPAMSTAHRWECWLRVDGHGWVCIATVHKGVVMTQGPAAAEVLASVQRMRKKGGGGHALR